MGDGNVVSFLISGQGTYSDSYNASLKSGFSAALDMAVGSSLGVHVREAYSFLMQNCAFTHSKTMNTPYPHIRRL